MFLGLRTVVYKVGDIEKAKEWYSALLGFKPYFDQPFYVGFNVGGFELGLDPDNSGVTNGNNSVAYWGVKDIKTALSEIVKLGAVIQSEIQDVGEGVMVASVTDPFGNVLGIIENPYFKFEE